MVRYLFLELPGWLLLLALMAAPAAFGTTDPWAIIDLEIELGVMFGLWLVGRCCFPRSAPVTATAMVALALILLQGWAMTWNAHFRHVAAAHLFLPLDSAAPWFPGTIDRAASVAAMLRFSALAGALLVAGDLAASRTWRRRLWWTASLTGAAFVSLGLLQKATDATAIFWGDLPTRTPFFGTYVYHGNAGSFINLVLPLLAGRVVLAIRRPGANGERALWITCLFLAVAAAFVNVSRSGAVIAALLLITLAAVELPRLTRGVWLPNRNVLWLYGGAAAVFLAGLVAFAGWESPVDKWVLLQSQLNARNPRLLALEACGHMMKEAGGWGFGPGTFALAFPHYTGFLGRSIAGTWRYAHDDYAQTIIDWGWVGMLAPAYLLFGGLGRSFAASRHWARREAEEDRLFLLCVGLALAGLALHAAMDFPLQIASLQIYAAVYLGLAWGADGIAAREKAGRLGPASIAGGES